jgi:hypothetical protein
LDLAGRNRCRRRRINHSASHPSSEKPATGRWKPVDQIPDAPRTFLFCVQWNHPEFHAVEVKRLSARGHLSSRRKLRSGNCYHSGLGFQLFDSQLQSCNFGSSLLIR